MSNQSKHTTNNPFDIFIIGARKGFTIATNNLVPNILMAYAVAEVLRILGVMKFVGEVFGPLMFIFGLPGEAVTVVLTAWLSSSASVGLAANMAANGILDARHVTILMPCFFLLGAQLQYMGRLLGVADVPKRYWPLLMSASLLNALLAIATGFVFEIPEKEIILQVSPEKLPVIKTEIINGKKCIVIPLEEDEKATINGTGIEDAPF